MLFSHLIIRAPRIKNASILLEDYRCPVTCMYCSSLIGLLLAWLQMSGLWVLGHWAITMFTSECTKIARFSAAAAAIFTAPQEIARFSEAPRCAISSAKKIASEPRFLLRKKWVKMVLAVEFPAIPSSAVKIASERRCAILVHSGLHVSLASKSLSCWCSPWATRNLSPRQPGTRANRPQKQRTASNTELSEFGGPHRVPARELS